MKKLFILCAMLLMVLNVSAYDVEVDGIYYNLNMEAKTAEVTSGGYSGSVVIPESIQFRGIEHPVTSIGDYAFWNCSGLTSVEIPNSVKSIGEYAFYDCSGLTSVEIPNSVTSIGYDAFYRCYGLTSVTIGNSVTSIGYDAFYRCYGLTSVTIPNSVTSIGDSAFRGCSGLTSVTIGNSVTSIGNSAFEDCYGLTSVHISDIAAWCEISFSGYFSNPLRYAHHLYLNGEEIKDLVIPNSVTSIGKYAFWYCSGLKNLTLGSGLQSIGYEAFASCENMEEVICLAENVPDTYSNAFYGSYIEYATLMVPDASIEKYKTADPWKKFYVIKGLSGNEPEVMVCEKPTIAFENGELVYVTATEGAEVISEVKVADAKKSYELRVPLTATYEITAYATKSGFENSNVATATLHWLNGSFESDTTSQVLAPRRAVLVNSNDGFITLSGLNEGELVEAYSADGKKIGSVRATGDAASFVAKSGEVVVLKIGEEVIKTVVK